MSVCEEASHRRPGWNRRTLLLFLLFLGSRTSAGSSVLISCSLLLFHTGSYTQLLLLHVLVDCSRCFQRFSCSRSLSSLFLEFPMFPLSVTLLSEAGRFHLYVGYMSAWCQQPAPVCLHLLLFPVCHDIIGFPVIKKETPPHTHTHTK